MKVQKLALENASSQSLLPNSRIICGEFSRVNGSTYAPAHLAPETVPFLFANAPAFFSYNKIVRVMSL